MNPSHHDPLPPADDDHSDPSTIIIPAGPEPPSAPPSTEVPRTSEPPRSIEVDVGDQPQWIVESQSLLRRRIRGAAAVFLFGFGLYVIRGFFIQDNLLHELQTVLVIVMALAIAVLHFRRRWTLVQLRLLELPVFGMPAVFCVTFQVAGMVAAAHARDPRLALATFGSSALYWFAMMVAYGMLIPNTWQRAAMAVAPMAITPIAVNAALAWRLELVDSVLTWEYRSHLILMMLIGGIVATYGTHVIGGLRFKIFQAKQLGQYKLTTLLGAGGMGDVYLAEHQLLKRPCVIKLIRWAWTGNPKTLARFEREVRTTATLSHWNTIEVFDYGSTSDGTFYYVMEYLPGMNLAALVERYGPLPPGRVIYLLRQICGALAEAHAVGFLHRNINPAHLYACERGGLFDVAKLMDFGLVKPLSETPSEKLTQDGSRSGTPRYMSPEQAANQHESDGRSDLYALGAVAYFLLTGRAPFEVRTSKAVILAHIRSDIVPPSQLRSDVPADLEQVVMRCLEYLPEARYPDAAALEQALSTCASCGQWTSDDAQWWWRELEPAPEAPA